MNSPLSTTQVALRGREVSAMTDAQVLDWIHACETMVRWKDTPPEARQVWMTARVRAEAEIRKRRHRG
ncbi:MAG: hypothetical protein ACREMW_14415 [Gemmatimonadales bacterium]